jgi:hypothetical protein
MDERAFDLWGVPLSDYVSFDDLQHIFIPLTVNG